MKMYLK